MSVKARICQCGAICYGKTCRACRTKARRAVAIGYPCRLCSKPRHPQSVFCRPCWKQLQKKEAERQRARKSVVCWECYRKRKAHETGQTALSPADAEVVFQEMIQSALAIARLRGESYETMCNGKPRKNIVKALAAVCVLLFLVGTAHAQTTVTPNMPFKIGATVDGLNTSEYRLLRGNVVVQTKPVSATSNGVIAFDEPGLPAGSYVYTVVAANTIPAGPNEGKSINYTATKVANVALEISYTHNILPNETINTYRVLEGSTVLASKPASDAVNGIISFSITNLSAGVHTLTNSTLSTFSAPTDVTTASPEVIIVSGTQTTPQTIAVTPNPVASGAPQTVTWTCTSGCDAKDWIGLFRKGAQWPETELWWPGFYTNGGASGTVQFSGLLGAGGSGGPVPPGDHEWRYCFKDGYSCSVVAAVTITPTSTPNVDCAGTWSEWAVKVDWSACMNAQQTRTLERTFTITTPPQGNGKACPASPETKVESRVCTSKVDAPVTTSCRWTLRAVPPDTTPGWRGQWRQNGQNVGNVDTTAPYERNFSVARGLFTYDIVWSTATVPAMTSPTVTLECK